MNMLKAFFVFLLSLGMLCLLVIMGDNGGFGRTSRRF